LSVLVKQTTEEVASAHPGSPSLADQCQTGGWSRRFQPKRPVRTMPVVVLDIPPEDLVGARKSVMDAELRIGRRDNRTTMIGA
jgi:hypothetical protein